MPGMSQSGRRPALGSQAAQGGRTEAGRVRQGSAAEGRDGGVGGGVGQKQRQRQSGTERNRLKETERSRDREREIRRDRD